MITKNELQANNFGQYNVNSDEWHHRLNEDIMYSIKEQALYHHDDVEEAEKLCVVKDIEELKELIYAYFRIEI